MVRSYGLDLVSRTPLSNLRLQALQSGVTIPTTDRRDVVGAKTFMAIHNIVLAGNVQFVTGQGNTHHRDPRKVIKQRLYEQVSGTGDAGTFLHYLTMVDCRDALVTLCVILDSEGIPRLDLSGSAMNTNLADAYNRARIFSNLSTVASHGYPTGLQVNPPPGLLQLPTQATSITCTEFNNRLPTW